MSQINLCKRNFPAYTEMTCQILEVFKQMQCSSVGKESACNAGDLGSIHWSGRSLGERNGNPLQHSCLENPMDKGAWWAPWHCKRGRHDLATKQQLWEKQCHRLRRYLKKDSPDPDLQLVIDLKQRWLGSSSSRTWMQGCTGCYGSLGEKESGKTSWRRRHCVEKYKNQQVG